MPQINRHHILFEMSLKVVVVLWSLSHVWLSYNPMGSSLSGFSVQGISQVRILEWVDISFSMGSSQSREQTHISCIDRFFTAEPPGGKIMLRHFTLTLSWIFGTKSVVFIHALGGREMHKKTKSLYISSSKLE